jgi:glutathione S-transferase
MFGTTPVEKALVDMWVRRVEFTVMTPVGMFWRHAHPRTAALLTQFKDFGESNQETYKGAQRYLNRELEGKTWLAGETYSMADICLFRRLDRPAAGGGVRKPQGVARPRHSAAQR